MFKRVILEEWQHIVPYICFAIVSGVFIYGVWRAVTMKKSEAERISKLPLEGDDALREKTGKTEKR